MKRMGLAAVLMAVPGAALAQAGRCDIPAVIPKAHVEGPSDQEPARQMETGGYTLAMIWSPQYCRTRRTSDRDAIQCGSAAGDGGGAGRAGPRFGFTLHGLWPDGVDKLWPQYCRPAGLVPEPVVRSTLCATPSPQLIQHEYAKHGTCMAGVSPAQYFRRSTGLYAGLRFPDMDALSRKPQDVASVSRAVARANRGLRADMVKLNLDKQGWLEEVWLCLDTAFRPTRCKVGGPPAAARVRIWRGHA